MRRRNTEAPIIIKKGKKHRHEFHGGNWKVAMADFMTSMFIFFLLLWLLNIVSKEQREGIADYFAPASVSRSTSGSGGILGGQSIIVDGTFPKAGGPPSIVISSSGDDGQSDQTEVDDFPPEDAEPLGNMTVPDEYVDQVRRCIESGFRNCQGPGQSDQAGGTAAGQDGQPVFEQVPDGPTVTISNTAEGFKITLQEVEGQPMFESGSSRPLPPTVAVLQALSAPLQNFPNKIKVAGHTDAQPYSSAPGGGYSNWELSSERANAARRVLVQSGVTLDRFGEVTGKAESEPLLTDPLAAGNRRIDIILLRQSEPGPIVPTSAPAESEMMPMPEDGVFGNGQGNGGQAGGARSTPGRAVQAPISLQEPLSIVRQ